MGVKLSELNFSELASMVNSYPWFAAARKELALRSGRGEEAALYVCSRRLLKQECPAAQAGEQSIREVIGDAPKQKVIVIGGDYFSKEQYEAVQKEDEIIVAGKDRNAVREDGSFADYCTETLAKVYAEQGYTEQAKFIYSKLSLRYPEKNAYFAALIENLDKPDY